MKIYLNGVENKLFRQMMKDVEVKYACFSFKYALRTPNKDFTSELGFLDGMIVDHGISLFASNRDATLLIANKYLKFLNNNESIIDFAFDIPQLGCYVQDRTNVKIVPFFSRDMFNIILDTDLVAVTQEQLDTPFFGNYYRRMRDKSKVHGFNVNHKGNAYTFDSINSLAWLLGKYGYTFYFDGKNINTYYNKKKSYRSIAARKLINEGYPIDYKSVLNDDTITINYMNLVAWKGWADCQMN